MGVKLGHASRRGVEKSRPHHSRAPPAHSALYTRVGRTQWSAMIVMSQGATPRGRLLASRTSVSGSTGDMPPPTRRISPTHLTVPGTDERELRDSGRGYRMLRHSVPG